MNLFIHQSHVVSVNPKSIACHSQTDQSDYLEKKVKLGM